MIGIPELMVALVVLAPVALIVFCWALYDLTKRQFSDGATKIVWALILLLLPIAGPIFYLVSGRHQGSRTPA